MHTPRPWTATKVPRAGWELTARLRSWDDRLLKFYRGAHRPQLTVEISGEELQLFAKLGYEEWCQFPADGWDKELAANMTLIAAAPDLLEALEDCVAEIEYVSNPNHPEVVRAKAAIAKAKGK